MGTRVSLDSLQTSISAGPPAAVDWTVLGHPSLQGLLTSDYVFRHPTTKSVCKNLLGHPNALWSLCEAIPRPDDLRLSANLIHTLRVFLSYVFASHQSYGFLYSPAAEAQSPTLKDEFAFSRQVRCVFQWKTLKKSLLVSVPQTRAFDSEAETKKLTSHVVANFESLREHLKATSEFVIFVSESGDFVSMSEIADYYAKNKPEDRIINPFSHERAEDAAKPMKLFIRTTECALTGHMAEFLGRLVDFYTGLPSIGEEEGLLARHACLALFVTALSSQMYYLRPSASDTVYEDFVHSPALDALFHKKQTALIVSALRDVAESSHSQPAKSTGLFAALGGLLFGAGEPSLEERLLPEVRNNALTLSLICLSSGTHFPNPFQDVDLGLVTAKIGSVLQNALLDTRVLMLLYFLLRGNGSFRSYFLSSPARDECVLELCRQLFTSKPEKHTLQHFTVILSALVLLSEDEVVLQTLCSDSRLEGVKWIAGYQTSGMALGAVVFLATLHFLKENALVRNAYLQVLISSLLFNLSTCVVHHEYTAQVFLTTLKSLFFISAKHTDDAKGEEARELLQVLLDLLVVQLSHTAANNPWLVYMVLHEADAFGQMQKQGLCPLTVPVVQSLISQLLPQVESDDVYASVVARLPQLSLPVDLRLHVFAGVQRFCVERDPSRLEAWAVPFVWMEAAKLGLSALKFEAELAYAK